jgi:hypothetical protein
MGLDSEEQCGANASSNDPNPLAKLKRFNLIGTPRFTANVAPPETSHSIMVNIVKN